MRRNALGSLVLIGMVIGGCGQLSSPLVASQGAQQMAQPVMPVRAAQASASGGLSIKSVLMPSLVVYKTFEEQQAQYIAQLKKYNDISWLVVSPVLNTQQISVDGEKVGYFVTFHGNAFMRKPTNDKSAEAFLVTYLIDAKGTLSYTSYVGASQAAGRSQAKPVQIFSRDFGDVYLRMPENNTLPPAIATIFNQVHAGQQDTIAKRYAGLKLSPTDPSWWNFGASEICYKDKMVGYHDDPAAWEWDTTNTKWEAKRGVKVTNFFDPAGKRLDSQAIAVDPFNPMGYTTFAL